MLRMNSDYNFPLKWNGECVTTNLDTKMREVISTLSRMLSWPNDKLNPRTNLHLAMSQGIWQTKHRFVSKIVGIY
jgi:hypothetical protein